MGKLRCAYNWHNTGRRAFFDGSTFETVQADYPVQFGDDFCGADLAIPAAGSDESGCKFVKKIVGAAPPTVVKGADAASGTVICTLTTDSQKQDAALTMDDLRNFVLTQGCIFEARIKLNTLPTLLSEAWFGLFGDWKDGGSDYRVQFLADGSGAIECEVDDNATKTNAAAGTTLTITDWAIFRIDMTDETSIKFYINGARVCGSTTFPYAATGANATLQPYVGLYKASGAGVGAITVDYIRVWQNRS